MVENIKWLSRVESVEIIKLLLSVIITLIIGMWTGNIMTSFIGFVLSYTSLTAVHYFYLRTIYKSELKILWESRNNPLKPYLVKTIRSVYNNVLKRVGIGVDVEVEPNRIDEFASAFFMSGKGDYVGVESTLPSKYFSRYPNYLNAHEEYVKKYPKYKNKRILIVDSPSELRNEYFRAKQDYLRFINWHKYNNVEVRYISKSLAEKLSKDNDLPTTDVGLWKDSFAVLFTPDVNNKTKIKFVDKETSLFKKINNYVEAVIKHSIQLNIKKDEVIPSPMPPQTVKIWRAYVGNDSRFHTTCPFLKSVFSKFKGMRGRILDAAPGLGDELFYLLDNNFDVEVNEADEIFRRMLWEEATKRKKNINIYGYDWREINKLGSNKYAGVYLLGNDLSMLFTQVERRKVIVNLYDILIPDGILVVDVRNYKLIKECIQQGNGVCDYDKTIGRKIMYTGKGVYLKLREKSGNIIMFEFYDKNTHELIGSIDTAYLSLEEVIDILSSVGFVNIEVYYDLSKEKKERAEFYTIVAQKPKY